MSIVNRRSESADNESLVGESTSVDKRLKIAYANKDGAKSRAIHENKLKMKNKGYEYTSVELNYNDNITDSSLSDNQHSRQELKHKGNAGDFIKSIIFGGMDGIITLFAIVASISGSDLNVETVLVLGFAKLVGDAISMGIGDFLSEKAEIDFVKSEYQREKWEFDNYQQGEIQEMIEIYKEKRIDEQDATLILTIMSKYPDFFVAHMMIQELELDSSVINDNPLKNGVITFLSFLIFGTVPLLSYLIFHSINIVDVDTDWKLIIAIILTCITLFGMGAVKGYYCNTNPFKSGIFVTMNGTFAAGLAYLIGWGLSQAFEIDASH